MTGIHAARVEHEARSIEHEAGEASGELSIGYAVVRAVLLCARILAAIADKP